MLALATFAPAQGKLGVPYGLQAGSTTQVTYSDPSRAGDSVMVEIDNGVAGEVQVIEIPLDENGNGSVDWDVPAQGWFVAKFNVPDAPDVLEKARAIALPPPSAF
ncbi:MAG: hypothetical protein ACYS5W_20825 [Planctomycetota bacterium]